MSEQQTTNDKEADPANPWTVSRRKRIDDVRSEINDSGLPSPTKDSLNDLMDQTYAATNGALDRVHETARLCGDLAIALTRFIVRDRPRDTDCAVARALEQGGVLTRNDKGDLMFAAESSETEVAEVLSTDPKARVITIVVRAVKQFVSKHPTAAVVFGLYFLDMFIRNPDKIVMFFKVLASGFRFLHGVQS